MKPSPRKQNRYAHLPENVLSAVCHLDNVLYLAKVNEPTYLITMPIRYEPQGLLDVLCDGVNFQVKDDNIYVWHSPEDPFANPGFFRMLRFEYVGKPAFRKTLKKYVQLTLSANQKIE